MSKLHVRQRIMENDDPNVVASIMIEPRSRGEINAGEYSADKPHPYFEVEVSATFKGGVSWEQVLLGSKEHYVLVYRVENRNDSPSFVTIKRTTPH